MNDKSEAEQMQLQALIQNESVIGNSSVHLGESFANLYNMIATSVDSKQGNSFVRVFEIPEFLYLLLSAAMFQTAAFIVYDAHTEAEIDDKYFFYGSILAFFTVSVFSDILF